MKKIYLIFLFFIFSGNYTFSQCTPDVSCVVNSYGTCPDTVANLPSAMVNHPYNSTISIKIPPTAADWGYALITITKIEVYKEGNTLSYNDGLLNLPPGITASCNGTNNMCEWPGGTNGCISLNGTPTNEGSFKIKIILKAYASGGALSLLDTVYGYNINVLRDTTNNCVSDTTCLPANVNYGTCPDTVNNLPTGMVNHVYNTSLSFKLPNNAAYWGYSPIILNKSKIFNEGIQGNYLDGIKNLPPNLFFYCSGINGNCEWGKNENGCIFITGVPSVSGNYSLNFIFKFYQENGFITLLDTIENYKIVILPDTTQITGIKSEISFDEINFIKINPNPVEKDITISFYSNSLSKVNISLIDLTGRQVFKYEYITEKGNINLLIGNEILNALPNGVYFIFINSYKTSLRQKIILNKKE